MDIKKMRDDWNALLDGYLRLELIGQDPEYTGDDLFKAFVLGASYRSAGGAEGPLPTIQEVDAFLAAERRERYDRVKAEQTRNRELGSAT